MNNEIKKFIEQNIELIEDNSWEEIYKYLRATDPEFHGLFNAAMLDADINPAIYLKYIPNYYLFALGIKKYLISDMVKSVGSYAFAHCKSLKSITIPHSVTNISGDAFYNCTALTSIVIGDNVTSIGGYAFGFCTSLTTIEIPNNVIDIGNRVFNGCTSLTSVTIGNSLASIGDLAFHDCNSLTSIKYLGTKKEALTKLKVRNKKWREGSAISKILCIDGEIEL